MTIRTAPARTPFDRTPFDRTVESAFDQIVGSLFDPRRPASGPVVDATWQNGEYVLTVDLPGVPASAVTVETAGATLTLAATTSQLNWKRSLRLGGGLDANKVSANHIDGRLTVRIGTVDAPVAHRVEVTSSPAPAEIVEATADTTDDTDQSSDNNDAG